MDEARTAELRQAILDALKERTKRMCLLVGDHFQIGHDQAFMELRPVGVGTGRHTLRVWTTHTKPQPFQETKAAWFPLPHVAQHLLTCLDIENIWRGQETHRRQRKRSAENSIILFGELPENITVVPSEIPGALDLTVTGLTQQQVKQVLSLLRPAEPTAPGGTDFWAELQADD